MKNIQLSIAVLVLVVTACVVFGINTETDVAANDQSQYEKALSGLPEIPDTAPLRCHILSKMNQPVKAIVVAKNVLEDTNVRPDVIYSLVDVMAREMDPKISLELVKEYINKNVSSPNIEASYALIQYKAGSTNSLHLLAQDFSKRKIESSRLAQYVFNEVVLPSYRSKKYNNALSAFDDVYLAAPQERANLNFNIEKAVISLDAGNYLDSLQTLDDGLSLAGSSAMYNDQTKAEIAKVKGDVYFQLKDNTNALIQYIAVEKMARSGNAVAELFLSAVTNRLIEISNIQEVQSLSGGEKVGASNQKKTTAIRIILILFSFSSCICLWLFIKKARSSGSVGLIVLLLLLVNNCGFANESDLQLNFGTITVETNIVSAVVIPADQDMVVATVSSSCGCTIPQLRPKDVVAKGHPVSILLHIGKSTEFGKQSRLVTITMLNGVKYRIIMQYEWIPLPFITPSALVFTPNYQSRDVTATFPKEEDIRFVKIIDAASDGPSVKKIDAYDHKLCLTFNVANMSSTKRGLVKILTTSTDCPVVEVPYLLVEHN